MASIADLFNAPSDFSFEGTTYRLREPTLYECGRYQRWLESEARASAAASTELPEDDRRNLLRDVNADVAAKVYAWGGAVCCRSLGTPDGIAKILSIVCEDQGVTYPIAMAMVRADLLETARRLKLAAEEAEEDPEKKAELARLLKSRGLPGNFLSTSWSDSATTPSADPPTSSPSAN